MELLFLLLHLVSVQLLDLLMIELVQKQLVFLPFMPCNVKLKRKKRRNKEKKRRKIKINLKNLILMLMVKCKLLQCMPGTLLRVIVAYFSFIWMQINLANMYSVQALADVISWRPFLYARSPEGHVLLQSRKFFFFRLSWNFFSARFGPLGLRNCNEKFSCRLIVVCHPLSVNVIKICHQPSVHSFCPICMKFGTLVYQCDA